MGCFCCKKLLIFSLLAVGIFVAYVHLKPKQKVEIKQDVWYGSGNNGKDDTAIKPFKIHVSDEDIKIDDGHRGYEKDLKDRLSRSRILHKPVVNSFMYGFNSDYLKTIQDYWLNKYDWRKHETALNNFEQFTTQIEGINVHFIHSKAKSGYKTVHPVLLVHGWPGNVQEFVKFIPILNDPKAHGINVDYAFNVIAPSIPGYGWSEAAKKPGFSQVECARVFKKLMERLSYDKYYLQGGDWGAAVTASIARLFPEKALGLHLNMVFGGAPTSPKQLYYALVGSIFPSFVFEHKKDHSYNIFTFFSTMLRESGYMHIQATKPDTVGTALNDSPIGLAAYILEKFSTWTNDAYRELPDGGLTRKFTMDELLTMISIYWFNGNIVASQRFYKEFFDDVRNDQLARQYLEVPTAHSHFGNEIFDKQPLELTKTQFNIVHYKEHADGGHFAAYEAPKELATDLFEFVSLLKKQEKGEEKQEL